MVRQIKIRILAISISTLALASFAEAKVYVNSSCHMKANAPNKVVQGDKQKDKKFPLASISKIVTSLWAIEKLGPNYRFSTKFHVTRNGNNNYDVHIEGGRDPIFGRNASYFIISELNKSSIDIKKIENLTFDEHFLLDWLAEESPRIGGDTPYYDTLEKQTEAIRKSLTADFSTAISYTRYNALKAQAAKIGVTMHTRPTIDVRRIEFKAKADFTVPANSMTLTYQSAPLKNIIKRMNNQSNNYIADHLYWNLGGTEEFNKYMKSALSMDSSDFEFFLGSGNNANYIHDPSKNIYNLGSCEAMIKTIYRLDQVLGRHGLKLYDLMSVAGMDKDSTVGKYDGNFAGTTVAKTGSVNRAKTLAGTVSTKNGDIYFVMLVNTDRPSEWGAANNIIKDQVNKLIINNGGGRRITYSEILTLPFDKNSALKRTSGIDLKLE